ncbi:MAG: glycosyltransferase [Novosphingobium sp.]
MHRSGPQKSPTVALVWAQFAAYHVDRCEAVARRLDGRAEVLAVEVATASKVYAWEPSGSVAGAHKITLFPGQSYEQIAPFQRFKAMFRALRHCDWVMIGISYADPSIIMLTWALRLCGVKLVVFSESKDDDKPRKASRERVKRLVLSCYHGAIVGATRHIAYMRKLGFGSRPVLPGYDGVGLERIRRQAGGKLAPDGHPFTDRDFVFVGRFVDKKNLINLLEGYALYVQAAGPAARRLVLAGSGADEPEMRSVIARHGLGERVVFPGFLTAEQVSVLLARSLALVLVSREEQWGLVVNEALALGLPAIVSHQVGSGDVLVRDGGNGFVVDSESPHQIATAMDRIAGDEAAWQRFVQVSHAKAWLGDTDRLADAVEAMIGLTPPASAGRLGEFLEAAGG